MIYPYAIVSDVHLHKWKQFATVLDDGSNSRLEDIADELRRVFKTVKETGGNTVLCAGDLFHVRGSLSPEALDRAMSVIGTQGISFAAIPGNHDLESKDSQVRGCSLAPLRYVGAQIFYSTAVYDDVVMVPWHNDLGSLRYELKKARARVGEDKVGNYDIIIHAPVDGVLSGIPPHGLTPAELADLGFRRVFAGHYHNHKDFGNGVYSIGALTHQTWSDVGTKAGFLLVYEDRVEWKSTLAPKFVEVTADDDEMTLMNKADGNYVRAKLGETDDATIKKFRESLEELGAKGVVIHAIKKSASEKREGVTTKSAVTLDQSIEDYIKERKFARETEVARICREIMIDARAVEE